jgi:uncharacterized membrane protein YfcA
MIGEGMFIQLDFTNAISVIILGFIGGTLSGFIGSGGAFFMTPGMMNLGVPGVVAVGSNITHKFGKALMGWKKHGELGNVDKKLGFFLVATSFIGIRIAVWLNSTLFEMGGGGHGEGGGSALGDLYISGIFIFVLSIVAISILRDAMKTRDEGEGPSTKIAEFFARLNLPPFITFTVADVRVSAWILAIVGLLTGYLAGTIGVGGFIGVPAMIYVFGIPTTVAAGTELFLAMFMGAWGAINYAWGGYVDLRLTLLLYSGSLIGIYIGAYGTKVVKEKLIRLVTGAIILLCVISRGIAVPMYLRQLDLISMDQKWDVVFNGISQAFLYIAGISGTVIIISSVAKSHYRKMKIQASLSTVK